MIELKVEISEVDYTALLDNLLPLLRDQLRESGNPLGMLLSNGMSAGMAKKVISTLPKGQMDALTADLINGNSKKLVAEAEKLAKQNNIDIKVASVSAAVR